MATDNTAAPNRGIDDILHETEMGSFIAKNKTAAIGVLVLALGAVIGFGIWNWQSGKRNVAAETAIYEYSQGSLKSFTDKAIDGAALVSGYKNLTGQVGNFEGVFPIGVETANQLILAKQEALAIEVLESLNDVVSNPYQRFVLATNLSVAYENSGNNEKALESLETLVKSNVGIMESKVYLDLGRLSLALGQNDKAKSNLQWVIDNSKDAEMTLLARLYLSKLEN